MAVILLLAILTVVTIIALRRRSHTTHAIGAKIALAVGYLLLIMQSVEVERAAVQADTRRLAGGTDGWFGKYWALAWILNLLAVICLHVYLFRARQSKDMPNSLIS
jgi:hypothetical protein